MMFKPTDQPRIFGIPPGVNFPKSLVSGLISRLDGQKPQAIARVRIIVNTQRMRRHLVDELARGPARLLPRIDLVSETEALAPFADLPPGVSAIERRLELSRLVRARLELDPSLAPRNSLFDLTDSLSALLDEMHSEGVDPAAVLNLELDMQSAHWERSRQFLSVVQSYADISGFGDSGPEARRRQAVIALIARWAASPPETPVILAGSTGSRGTTALLMQAVAGLPQGAVVLPGFDFDLPGEVWETLQTDDTAGALEDHPQYRFASFLSAASVRPDTVSNWADDTGPTKRNRLISLSLRPAPVTYQWRTEGPYLGDLTEATADFTLLEAPQPRDEAMAIAVALREAAETGRRAALITPDRTLGRRVAAALQRWKIEPDDSGGKPLALSAPGRLLRMVCRMMGQPVQTEALISVLKHPLVATGGDTRGRHLLLTREFELFLRDAAVVHVTHGVLDAFSDKAAQRSDWCGWLSDLIERLDLPGNDTLGARHSALLDLVQAFACGPGGSGTGQLWLEQTGEKAKAACDTLATASIAATPVAAIDHQLLLDKVLAEDDARRVAGVHPGIMIWGTLEARVQGADLVILGGLNEGNWPGHPEPDPWLSRQMRRIAGLLSPERSIGLAAHDFQQAVGAPQVILSRALRDDEAQTVPARWVNRLVNLLGGLPDQNGQAALDAMRARGNRYLSLARQIDAPSVSVPAAARVAPAPPAKVRPKSYTVTDIERLVRDPYHIYATRVLGLRRLKPLRPEADAALRGTVFHKVAERFGTAALFGDDRDQALFLDSAQAELKRYVPWPSVREVWFGHLRAIASRIANEEWERRQSGAVLGVEVRGACVLPSSVYDLRGKADRIDRALDGKLRIFDFKSSVPSKKQVAYFRRQLLVEAVMAELGAFEGIPATEVGEVAYLSLAQSGKNEAFDMNEIRVQREAPVDIRVETVQRELIRLLDHFAQDAMGYVSRRATESDRWDGDFDHLARFGEWDLTAESITVVVP